MILEFPPKFCKHNPLLNILSKVYNISYALVQYRMKTSYQKCAAYMFLKKKWLLDTVHVFVQFENLNRIFNSTSFFFLLTMKNNHTAKNPCDVKT